MQVLPAFSLALRQTGIALDVLFLRIVNMRLMATFSLS